jgi:hypothetical protein
MRKSTIPHRHLVCHQKDLESFGKMTVLSFTLLTHLCLGCFRFKGKLGKFRQWAIKSSHGKQPSEDSLSPLSMSQITRSKVIALSMRGRDVGCEGVCDDDNLERRRSIFDTIEDPVKETVRLFFSNQANFEDEATLLVYAGKRDADCLEERFITELNWENRVMAGIIADAIVAFRKNPGQLLLFRSFLSALSSPFSRTNFNSSSNIEW